MKHKLKIYDSRWDIIITVNAYTVCQNQLNHAFLTFRILPSSVLRDPPTPPHTPVDRFKLLMTFAEDVKAVLFLWLQEINSVTRSECSSGRLDLKF